MRGAARLLPGGTRHPAPSRCPARPTVPLCPVPRLSPYVRQGYALVPVVRVVVLVQTQDRWPDPSYLTATGVGRRCGGVLVVWVKSAGSPARGGLMN